MMFGDGQLSGEIVDVMDMNYRYQLQEANEQGFIDKFYYQMRI